MKAVIEQPYVPYVTEFATFGILPVLSITFQLKNQVEQVTDGCGINLIKICDSDVLLPVTAARLEWQFCRKKYSLSDTDISTGFNVDLIQVSGQTVAILVEVNSNFVDTANDFWLYGTINGQNVLLARGRIYVTLGNPHPIDDTVGDQEEWMTVEW